MADPAAAGDPLARYDAIERAYCDGAWDSVLAEGRALLATLTEAGDPLVRGLRPRLQLLLAHTHLHGRGDAAAAAAAYRAALADDPEPSLRAIAEEGLRQCAPTDAPAGGLPAAPPAQDPAATTLAAPAAPWLEAAPLIPEVVEEPELIEVHQADPALAENLDLPLREPAPAAVSEGAVSEAAGTPAEETASRDPAEEAELRRGLLRVVVG